MFHKLRYVDQFLIAHEIVKLQFKCFVKKVVALFWGEWLKGMDQGQMAWAQFPHQNDTCVCLSHMISKQDSANACGVYTIILCNFTVIAEWLRGTDHR